MPSERPAFLYIIAAAEDGVPCAPVKVGISHDPFARIATIRTSCSHPINGIIFFRFTRRIVAAEIEQRFHRYAHDFRTTGEWFDLGPITAMHMVVATIRAFAEHHGLPEDLTLKMLRHAGVFDVFPKRVSALRTWGVRS